MAGRQLQSSGSRSQSATPQPLLQIQLLIRCSIPGKTTQTLQLHDNMTSNPWPHQLASWGPLAWTGTGCRLLAMDSCCSSPVRCWSMLSTSTHACASSSASACQHLGRQQAREGHQAQLWAPSRGDWQCQLQEHIKMLFDCKAYFRQAQHTCHVVLSARS